MAEGNKEVTAPPEGILQEEWDSYSDTEKQGILDDSNEGEGDLDDDALLAIAGDDLTPEQQALKDKEAADAVVVKKEEPVVDPVVPADPVVPVVVPVTPTDDVTDDDLLKFRPVINEAELPGLNVVPDPIKIQLGELDEQYEAGDIKLREYNEKRDEINRQIVIDNMAARDMAKLNATWEAEQSYFLKARPMYLEKGMKGTALYGALCEAVKSLSGEAEYANASGIQLMVAADKAVKEAFGITTKEAVVVDRKPAAVVPDLKTLASVPAATGMETGGPFEAIDKLTGQAYEDALEKMTDEMRARYADSRT